MYIFLNVAGIFTHCYNSQPARILHPKEVEISFKPSMPASSCKTSLRSPLVYYFSDIFLFVFRAFLVSLQKCKKLAWEIPQIKNSLDAKQINPLVSEIEAIYWPFLYYLLNWGSVLFHVCKQTDLAAMGHLQYSWIAQWNKARRYNGHEMQGTEVSRILNYRRLSNSYWMCRPCWLHIYKRHTPGL